MSCPKCGIQVYREANFCHNCGQVLGANAAPMTNFCQTCGQVLSANASPATNPDGTRINSDPIGGDQVGGNYTDIEQIDNSRNVAVGEGNTVTSTVVQSQRPGGREISFLWGMFKYATFATAFLLMGGVVYFVAVSNLLNPTTGSSSTETPIPVTETPPQTPTQILTPTLAATQVLTPTLTPLPARTPDQLPAANDSNTSDSSTGGNGASGEPTQQAKTLSTILAEATRSAAGTATRSVEVTQLAAGTATHSAAGTATQSASISATRAAVWTATRSAAATNAAAQRATEEAFRTQAARETQVIETIQAQVAETQEAQADRTRAAQPTLSPTPTWTPSP